MLSFVILHTKRCLEYLILQFPTLRKKVVTRLVPSHPPTKGFRPHAQGLRPHGLGIYVVICHFTFKKVSRISYYNSQPLGSKVMRRLTLSCPPTQGSCRRALGIYVVICHFTFKKVSRIPHWWLVRVTLVVNWLFLPQNFGPVVGTYEGLLLLCECRWGWHCTCRW